MYYFMLNQSIDLFITISINWMESLDFLSYIINRLRKNSFMKNNIKRNLLINIITNEIK